MAKRQRQIRGGQKDGKPRCGTGFSTTRAERSRMEMPRFAEFTVHVDGGLWVRVHREPDGRPSPRCCWDDGAITIITPESDSGGEAALSVSQLGYLTDLSPMLKRYTDLLGRCIEERGMYRVLALPRCVEVVVEYAGGGIVLRRESIDFLEGFKMDRDFHQGWDFLFLCVKDWGPDGVWDRFSQLRAQLMGMAEYA